MANRTPAEKERINKKHKRNFMIFQGFLFAVVAVFAFIGEAKGWFRNKAAMNELDGVSLDPRLEYFEKLGEADNASVSDDAVRLPIIDGRGERGQVIVTGKEKPVSVTIKLAYAPPADEPESTPDIFAGVDPVKTESPDENSRLSVLSPDILRYLAPLFPDEDTETLKTKIDSALEKLESGKGSTFLFGVYGVSFTCSEKEELITVSAEPS